jgi:hypothetical protein
MHPGPAGHRLIAELALAQLAGAGFRAVAAVEPSPTAPPRKAMQFAWLVTNGTPWFIKRSVDLIPGLVVVVLREWFIAPGWNAVIWLSSRSVVMKADARVGLCALFFRH